MGIRDDRERIRQAQRDAEQSRRGVRIVRGQRARDGLTFVRAAQSSERLSRLPVGQAVDRRDLPREGGSLPTMGQFPEWTETARVFEEATRVQSTPAAPIVQSTAVNTQGQKDMDLGDILGGISQAVDIYGRYRGYKDPGYPVMGRDVMSAVGFQRPPTQFVTAPRPQVGMDTFGVQPAFFPPAVLGAGSVGAKIGTAIAGLGLGLAADEIAAVAATCARVKSRRRRRRLATHSDIKDLAALKAVLGAGKAFDTWIATRKM